MSEHTSRLALPLIAANQAQKHVPVNEALVRLDALVQLSVLDRTLSDPPSSPEDGDRYIVGAAATGAWSGHDDDIASYDGGWNFIAPQEGWRAWDASAQELVVFTAEEWAVATSGEGGYGGGNLQNVDMFGLGSEADETNPFSAKLNNALWTSQEVAEGGTGDLRYVLNKEASANVLSLLLQSAYGGRAEFGLIGDDDLLFKVSADGTTWREALRIDRTTGRPRFPQGGVREQLTANRTYYVRTDGSDSNNGLANTSGGAFLTIQKAIDVACALDASVYDVTIQIGNGTYTGIVRPKPFVGSGTFILRGDPTTHSNVLIHTTSSTAIRGDNCGAWKLSGIQVQTTTSGLGIDLFGPGCFVTLDGVSFAACASYHLRANGGAVINVVANYTISGGSGNHVRIENGGTLVSNAGLTVTLTGTPAFSQAFALASMTGIILFQGQTFLGSATGARYSATMGGVIQTNGGGASYFPGSSAGSTATGGQYV